MVVDGMTSDRGGDCLWSLSGLSVGVVVIANGRHRDCYWLLSGLPLGVVEVGTEHCPSSFSFPLAGRVACTKKAPA